MKTIVKLALGTAVLAAGVGAANAAVPLPSTGSSDLLFFVADTSTSTSYTQVLSQTIGSAAGSVFNSSDAINNAANAVQGTSVATITGKSNFTYDATANANLESFITTAENAHQNLVWGIYAGAYTGASPAARKAIGAALAVVTAPSPTTIVVGPSSQLVNSSLSAAGSMPADIKALNANLDSFGGGLNDFVAAGTADTSPDFYAMGFDTGIGIGGSAKLYGFTADGNSAGLGYDLGSISFDGSTLSFTGNSGGTTPTVPLPAAAWLFGSGLLGLLGIGRRRNVAPAA